MTSFPEVSVVIPSYNAAETLGEAIRSMLGQSAPPAEVIVVDDGSTDDTDRVLREFGSSVTVVRQANGGLPVARNAGCARARGELIAFMDADDLSRPERIEIQRDVLLSHADAVLCHSDFASFGLPERIERFHSTYYNTMQRHAAKAGTAFSNVRRTDGPPPATGLAYHVNVGRIRQVLAHGNVVHPPTMMFRRSLFEDVGPFDARLRNMCDWEWIFRASGRGAFAFVDIPLLDYRLSPGQLSGTAHRPQAIRDVIEIARRIADWEPDLHVREIDDFESELAAMYTELARSLALSDRGSAARALAQGVRHQLLPRQQLSVLAQIVLPRMVVRKLKQPRGEPTKRVS